MFGRNKILRPQQHDGLNLDIVEIFPTIQGEGPYAGQAAIFIRLGGCNLACDFCDTEFDEYHKMSLDEISIEVEKLKQKHQLIVITGGEPMRQPIEKLCQKLIDDGFTIQIETNGTIYRDLPQEVKIICSPKVTNGKYHEIRSDLLERINALKFIISANHSDYQKLPSFLSQENYKKIPIYLQPMDEYDSEKNKLNQKLTAKLVEENNYILSLQLHKILGVK